MMVSKTQRKQDLRAIIHRQVARYIGDHPDETYDIAMSSIRQLTSKMTITELGEWNQQLALRAMMRERDSAAEGGSHE